MFVSLAKSACGSSRRVRRTALNTVDAVDEAIESADEDADDDARYNIDAVMEFDGDAGNAEVAVGGEEETGEAETAGENGK